MSDWKNVQYKNGKYRTSDEGGGGSSTFAGLDDVSFNNIQNGQVPKYNSTTQKWENANESGGVILPEYVYKVAMYSSSRTFVENMKAMNMSFGATAFSVEAYYYAYDVSDGYILSFGVGSNHAAFGMKINGVVTWGDDWNYSGISTGVHHRVITYDGNSIIKTYEDNVLINTRTLNSPLNISDSRVYFGTWIDGNYSIRGNVRYVKYYNRALTADEVALLYANRKNQL